MKNQPLINKTLSSTTVICGKKLTVLAICMIIAVIPISIRAQVISPVNYYTFNGASASTDSSRLPVQST